MLPPKDVYSAKITNNSEAAIDVKVDYAGPEAAHAESITLNIAPGATVEAPEKEVSMGSWTARKVIKTVTVGDKVLSAPFPGVNSPTKDYAIAYPANF